MVRNSMACLLSCICCSECPKKKKPNNPQTKKAADFPSQFTEELMTLAVSHMQCLAPVSYIVLLGDYVEEL